MGRDTTAAGREGICAEQSESKVKSRAQEESDALIPASAVLATWEALHPPMPDMLLNKHSHCHL